jgi:hypothetical protein
MQRIRCRGNRPEDFKVTDTVLMRKARKAIWAIGLIVTVSSFPTHYASGQNAALAFRKGFVGSYVAAAVKHGRPAGPAAVEANCICDIIAARMTLDQLAELNDELHRSQPPAAIVPLMPDIKRQCLHRDGVGPATMPSASPAAVQPTTIDDADSAAVARELRRLRVAEESRLIAARGAPVMLPTGTCTAIVTVDNAGHPAPAFPVMCADERLQAVMRQAVTAAAPLNAAPGSVVRLAIIANDPEPIPRMPARSQMAAESLLLSPPKNFVVGYQANDGRRSIREFVPIGEAVGDWSEMLTVQLFHGAAIGAPTFLQRVAAKYMNDCPGTTAKGIFTGQVNGYVVSTLLLKCPRNPATDRPETTAFRIIKGNDALYSVQYAWRSVPTNQAIDDALHSLGKVAVCDRTADHPCPSFDAPASFN